MYTRRSLMGLALGAVLAGEAGAASASATLKSLHKKIGGRLGVHILDSQSGRRIKYDDGSRYAMASTFKLPLAASLLWQVDRGAFPLTQTMPIARKDLQENSPILDAAIQKGVTELAVRDLCGAAVAFSDNAATNILLNGMGGPETVTKFLRSIGDKVTRCDRIEPDLNSNLPGDERDTTTPFAMTETLLRIFTQDVLTLGSRALLIEWMMGSRTGLDRVRKGLPRGWQVGDKTGTGQNGAYNDLVVTWPPNRRPILAAVYMSESTRTPQELAAAQQQIGELIGREKWP